jgi:transposase
MSAIKSWTVSDELWKQVAPLIPKRKRERGRKYLRRPGGGRKAMDARKVFEAIVFVLRTGCQWKSLPKAVFGSASSVHKYFLEWKAAGVFVKLWRKGLAEYDEMEGIAWAWQSIDGAMVKAPLAQEAVGPNPTDRGKKGEQAKRPRRRAWNPAVVSRERGTDPRRETAGTHAG